jgi:hypothetical protein
MSQHGLIALAAALGGCASTPPDGPAVLARADAGSMQALSAAIAAMTGAGTPRFGPSDPSKEAVFTILPPPAGPLEGRSLARPEVFALSLVGGVCQVTRKATGETRALAGVACRRMG